MTVTSQQKQAHFSLSIVSTEATLFTGEAHFVWATGELGELGIAPGHTPLITALKPGYVRVKRPDEQEDIFYVSGGMLEVQPHQVTVLADTAVRGQELDEAAASEAKRRAEEALSHHGEDFDYSATLAELSQAIAKLHIIEQVRKIQKFK